MSETVAMLPSASRQPLVPLCCCQPRQTDNAMSETVAMLPSASRQPLCHRVAVSLVRRRVSCPRQWLCCHQPRDSHCATVLLSASSDGQCHVRDSGYVAISLETATVSLCCCQPRQTDNVMSETVAMLPSSVSRRSLCCCQPHQTDNVLSQTITPLPRV